VGDDYVIGPGDEIEVLMWGRLNEHLTYRVGRDGSVLVNGVGPIQVAGLTFGQVKKLLQGRLEQIDGVQVAVTMGQLRTIQVFVVGQVNQPGSYTVSALSRISSALQAAGGISKVGSLRHVELRRGNQVIDVLDLYDLLLAGKSIHDARLDDGDVIFVPVIGSVVAVAGDVKVPAIYELAGRGASIRQVLQLSGGVSAFSYLERVQVERVVNHQLMVALDIDLQSPQARRFVIRDGDVVKVYSVLPDQTNIVKLTGNVRRPGDYQWRQGMRVSDLVRLGEGTKPHTFFQYALIRRMEGPQKFTHFVPVDLGAALAGDPSADRLLDRMDELSVLSEDDLRVAPHVVIQGQVRKPGTYSLSEDMRLSDLIYLAGGLTADADRNFVQLARTQVVDNGTQHIYMKVNLAHALDGSRTSDLLLKDNDEVFVNVAPNWHMPWVVQVAGRVLKPGNYTIGQDDRLSSVLQRCGGFLPDAFPEGMVLLRTSVQRQEQTRLDESRARLSKEVAQYSISLPLMSATQNQGGGGSNSMAAIATLRDLVDLATSERALGRVVIHYSDYSDFVRSPDNLVLEDGDRLQIPKRPSSVSVLGQVYNPTSIVARPNLTVADYVAAAGGAMQTADLNNLLVISADGSVVSQQGLKSEGDHRIFPFLNVVSPNIMDRHVNAGDTIYVPENLNDIPAYIRTQYHAQIATIIAGAAQTLAVIGLLAIQI